MAHGYSSTTPQDALFQIVPHAREAYLKGRTMYDHIASVQLCWDSGLGDPGRAGLL